jgi:MFS family permease
MISRSKKLFYLFEGITSFSSVYYSNFLFFFMQKQFGFGDLENLFLAALNGLVYTVGSWQGGKFAQKHGPVVSITIGVGGICCALFVGGLVHTMTAQIATYAFWTLSVCFIWPALEAIVSEDAGDGLSNMVGLYNLTWAGSAASAYFVTGLLLEKLGLQSLFWLPFGLHLLQLLVLLPIAAAALRLEHKHLTVKSQEISIKRRPSHSKKFLYMSWLANPFSYVAISTVIPLIPSISQRFGLSTGLAGICCSVWMFARLLTFFALWKWSGWHYRFKWMFGAFLTMIVCYAGMLLANSLSMLILTQTGFGISIGIIYYSSLFYSMNISEEKGANGGLHEAMIGAGLFVGPAFGAACLYFIPAVAGISGMPVNGLLLIGFTGLIWMGKRKIEDMDEQVILDEVKLSN